jgi:hypothetical protein
MFQRKSKISRTPHFLDETLGSRDSVLDTSLFPATGGILIYLTIQRNLIDRTPMGILGGAHFLSEIYNSLDR